MSGGWRKLRRLATMSPTELVWRSRAASRIAIDRGRTRLTTPRWNRGALAGVLAPLPALAPMRAGPRLWTTGRRRIAAFGRYLVDSPQRFVIGPGHARRLTADIQHAFPGQRTRCAGARDAARRRRVRPARLPGSSFFASAGDGESTGTSIPCTGAARRRRSGRTCPFLDPVCGDHKIIWELNRHQHWLALGRAFWLTGDERYRDHALDELASWLDANPPLIGHQLGEHAGARVPVALLDLGAQLLSSIRTPATTRAVDRRSAARRSIGSSTHIERNLSHYFSPNTHLLGEALALYVAARALPVLRASARRAALGRAHPVRGDRPADRRRWRALRAVDALSPLHARLLSAGAGRRPHH